MKYKVNDEGVEVLQIAAINITTAVDQIAALTGNIQSIADEYNDTLGPHKASLDEALNHINDNIQQATEPAMRIADKLNEVAESYQEIICNNPFDIADSSAEAKGSQTAGGVSSNGSSQTTGAGGGIGGSTSNSSLESCKNFDELSDYVESKYGLKFDESVKQLDFTTVKSTMLGVESVIQDYPDVGTYLTRGEVSTIGVMSCNGTKITFNPVYFTDAFTLSGACEANSATGFWIPNSSPASIGAHETGHGVEWAIIVANHQYKNDRSRIKAWNDCTEAKKIVREAITNIQATRSARASDLILGISGYAGKSASEAMAEAFADAYANGSNANPLSIEIKRAARRVLSEYKGGW